MVPTVRSLHDSSEESSIETDKDSSGLSLFTFDRLHGTRLHLDCEEGHEGAAVAHGQDRHTQEERGQKDANGFESAGEREKPSVMKATEKRTQKGGNIGKTLA